MPPFAFLLLLPPPPPLPLCFPCSWLPATLAFGPPTARPPAAHNPDWHEHECASCRPPDPHNGSDLKLRYSDEHEHERKESASHATPQKPFTPQVQSDRCTGRVRVKRSLLLPELELEIADPLTIDLPETWRRERHDAHHAHPSRRS